MVMEVYLSYNSQTNNASRQYLMKIISDRDLQIYQIVNFYAISSVNCLFGIVANVMNIIVFYKQGFDNTMNISFFGLAISDLCGLICLLWCNISLSGLLVQAGVSMDPPEVAYLTGGHTHICFARITSWITVYITAERSLCITLPLKVKQLITPRRTTIILCVIYVLIIISFQPEFQTAYIGWRFDENRNKTILGLIFTSSRKSLEGVTFILYAILGFAAFVIVIIFTLVLVIQLKRQSNWRKNVNTNNNRSEAVSSRERKTMSMVVMIATVLIICYAPGVALSSVSFFEPEFSIFGQYVNSFFALWSFVFSFEAFNSSINIFVYYYMSTKYRETFRVLFCLRNAYSGND